MLDQLRTHVSASIKQQRKYSFRQAAFANALLNRATHEFARSRVSGMRFHDHWISSSKRGGGVATRDRERQWEVAGAEYDRRSEWPKHRADVRFGQWLPARMSSINPRLHP